MVIWMFVIQMPLGRIVNDIFSDFIQFLVVADSPREITYIILVLFLLQTMKIENTNY